MIGRRFPLAFTAALRSADEWLLACLEQFNGETMDLRNQGVKIANDMAAFAVEVEKRLNALAARRAGLAEGAACFRRIIMEKRRI